VKVTIRKSQKTPLLKKEIKDKRPSFFLDSGSKLLNLALSGDAMNGGWAGQRIINVVGDTTTGKTLLACEAVNALYYKWQLKKKNTKCSYRDVEAAFDFSLAEEFGMPLDWIDWGDEEEPIETIQQWFTEIHKQLREDKHDCHLTILDSLDGISEEAELARAEKLADGKKLESGTYGTQKAKEMSAGLRLVSSKVNQKNMIIFIVSQVRQQIGNVSRVRSFTRSAGKALDHYASQIVWLAEKEPIYKTLKGDRKLKVGKTVQVKVSKNRLYREGAIVNIDILDRYGIDDIGTMLNWLEYWGYIKKEKQSYVFGGVKAGRDGFIKAVEESPKLYVKLIEHLQKSWDEVEDKVRPKRKKKYGNN
jgi:RecA/RadA recombinase